MRRLSLPRLWPGKLIILYLTLVAALFIALFGLPFMLRKMPVGRAVPVLSQKGVFEQKGEGKSPLPREGTPKQAPLQGAIDDLLEGVLRLGLPLLDVYILPYKPTFDLNQAFSLIIWALGGGYPGWPMGVLQQMPILAMAEPGEYSDGSDVSPVPVPAPAPAASMPEQHSDRPLEPGANPLVIIYSTHSQESFVPVLAQSGGDKGKPYTTQADKSIVRVAEELARSLQEANGVPVVHLSDFFDRNGLTGAYMESERGVRDAMKRYRTARVLVDVHRDSAPREATVTVIGGEPVARVMFVVGKGNQHLPNPGWKRNQEFAAAVAQRLQRLYVPDKNPATGEAYPPLVRQLKGDDDDNPWTYTRNGRFNQHLSPQALLVEIGGPGNTMAEELRAARMVAKALADVLRGR